jgi:hypothetical protein
MGGCGVKAYPGATSQILVAGQSQPALYGPMLGGFIYNPATIQDQGIFTITGEIIEVSAFFLGPLCTVALMNTGLDQVYPDAIRALALTGFVEIARDTEVISYGPPELLYVSLVPPAGSKANTVTEAILPGQLWRAPECYCGSVYVSAATAGHLFTSVLFQNPPSFPPAPVPGDFPPTGPTTRLTVLPSYLYKQYDDDDDLQGIVQAYNDYTQLFINWFNNINLPIYMGLSGALLDWVAEGLYGIYRSTLFSNVPEALGPLCTVALLTEPLVALDLQNDITNITVTSDDVFKRFITWRYYKGDGKNLTTEWLRRRIIRFLFGAGGGDYEGQCWTLSIEWTKTNQLTITIVSAWSVCQYSGALCSGPLVDAPLVAFAGVLAPQPVPGLAPQFKEGIDTGSLESPAQYSTTVRIGPKGAFGIFSLSYSAAAL